MQSYANVKYLILFEFCVYRKFGNKTCCEKNKHGIWPFICLYSLCQTSCSILFFSILGSWSIHLSLESRYITNIFIHQLPIFSGLSFKVEGKNKAKLHYGWYHSSLKRSARTNFRHISIPLFDKGDVVFG